MPSSIHYPLLFPQHLIEQDLPAPFYKLRNSLDHSKQLAQHYAPNLTSSQQEENICMAHLGELMIILA